MNRFLTRRKDKASDDGSGGKKKKGKKGQVEPEPALNLATVLPSTDDFRTSLIMPSLSTRFSMLREQDDPSSKLGKASDDSVLQPKRQSRLHEFGFVPGGLSDIAEVSSLKGSIRPPFAAERQDSFDSHNTDDSSGSIMSRARPGEGNVLFGGRQKVYKISNTGSSKSLGGRILYDDDLHLSAFQRLRHEEKERAKEQEEATQGAQESQDDQHAEPSSPTKDTYSPSVSGYSQRRQTSSSTTSGNPNARSSTAATSIASQGANSVTASSPSLPISTTVSSTAANSAAPTSPTELNRSATKGRRLYEQALDQHMYDQQSSAINRLNSIQRTRAPTGRSTPPLLFSQTRSATNLNDRFNRNPLNAKETQSNGSSPVLSRPQSPPLTSPLGSDSDEAQMLSLALQPNDRGKATAMGAFNKPKHAFSEQQYAERLKQLHQERDSPLPKPIMPKKPSLRERAEIEQRKRAGSGTSDKSKTSSRADEKLAVESSEQSKPSPSGDLESSAGSSTAPTEKAAPSAFSVFQSAANLMKTAANKSQPSPPAQAEPASQDTPSPDSQAGATFFASPGSSDDEDEAPKPAVAKSSDLDRRFQNLPTATGPAPPILDHPALRSRSNSRGEAFTLPALRSRSTSRPAPALRSRSNSRPAMPQVHTASSSPKEPVSPHTASQDQEPDVDSPTLGPNNGGLSGLIRQHLRNLSTVSSDYGENSQIVQSPPPVAVASQGRQPASDTNTTTHSSYTHSNPWDLDDMDNYGEGESTSSTSPVEAQKSRLRNQDHSAMLISPQAVNETISEWEKEMKKTHKREPSVEEREAFQRELALRQRAVQESLRSKAAQSRSRNASPAPGGGLKNALNMLRAKSSKESFATVDQKHPEASHKAMRMLGLGVNSANASSTSLAGSYVGDNGRSDERVGHRRILQQSEQDAQRELENRQRSTTNDSNHDSAWKGRTPPPSSNSSMRGRSSSEVSSGRSRSRPRQHRDDADLSTTDGAGARNTAYSSSSTPTVPENPGPFAEKTSMESQRKLRSRSNSRTAAANYFESKHLQPIQTSLSPVNGASPRLSPAPNAAMHQFSPGLPASPRPSPGAPSPSVNSFRPHPSPLPPFSATSTPPISAASTPVAAAFHTGAAAIMPSNGTLRKKSINKADISEPIFLSTTSVIDTVNLPSGASLKNGTEAPPPLPPINPMRRKFGFGRTPSDDPAVHAPPTPSTPYGESMYTNSSETLANKAPPPRQRLRKSSSEGRSLHAKSQVQPDRSPAVPSMPFGARNGSPPRPINHNPAPQQNMDGAMF